MWAFVAVSLALSTPCVQTSLELLFAELSVVFLHWVGVVAVATSVAFVAAVALHLSASKMPPRVLAIPRYSVSSLLVASIVVRLSTANAETTTRTPADTSVPWSLADNATALEKLKTMYTECKYSKEQTCIDNPQNVPELGVYERGPGHCVAFDSAYVTLTNTFAATPNRYLPISVDDAYAQGFRNKYSEWSTYNQEQFKVDCPLLYNQTIANGQDNLCCTESQYEGLQTQVRLFPGQCTACKANLRSVWCQMTCSPNNSEFIEPVQVRIMEGDKNHSTAIFPAYEEANYYVGRDWIRDIYDFCEKDDSFTLLCNPLQNCVDGYGLLNYMGEYKFDSLGSPLQINVKTMDQFPEAVQKEKFCACGSNATDCFTPSNTRLENCFGVCGSVCSVTANDKRTYTEACYGAVTESVSNDTQPSEIDTKWDEFSSYMAANIVRTHFETLNYFLVIFGVVAGLVLVVGFLYMAHRARKYGPVSTTDDASRDTPRVAKPLSAVDDWISFSLKRWGVYIALGSGPKKVSAVMLFLVVVLSLGLTQLEVETTPVKLWVSTSSRPYKERDRYAELFTPFYRSAQIIMVPKDGGSISRAAYLREAIRIQQVAANVTYGPSDASYPESVRLEDICWKATGSSCTINSITQYFQNRLDHFDFYQKYGLAESHFATCMYSPTNQDVQTCNALRAALKTGDSIPSSMSDCPCLSAFGSPMNLYNTYLGGFPAGAEENTTLYLQSQAMVSTMLIYNYYEDSKNDPAINWEHKYLDYMKSEALVNELFTLYFTAETSVQDEIERESSGDMAPAILSYSLMIVYVSLGINRWKFDKSFFKTSKIAVGFLGIMCIILAVTTTIGLFMWFGVKLQLVIMEVVPFLTLAIGVDNIFLLVHAVEDKHALLRREQPELFQGLGGNDKALKHAVAVLVSEGVSYIGPSIIMASCTEAVAFLFGCISPMPVVMWFAAFSAVAVIINLILQMTLLLAIITSDKRRELKDQYEFSCCMSKTATTVKEPSQAADAPTQPGEEDIRSGLTCDDEVLTTDKAFLHFFDRCISIYTNFLSRPLVKLIVLLLFLAMTLTSIYSIEHIKHGLPQAESMPSESYMTDYFNALDKYLATGPPTYFVVEGGYGRNPKNFNLNDQSVEAKFCKSKDFCDDYSISKILDALANSMDDKMTHFAPSVVYSWMDDFWGFMNPDSECCRVDAKTAAYLPIDSDNAAYTATRKTNPTCLAVSTSAPPVPENMYMSLFSMFSSASAGSMCSYGGGSIYRGQFSIDEKPIPVLNLSSPQVVLQSSGFGKNISAFSYMVQSRSNPTQQDYIDLYSQGRRAAEWISQKTGVDVWVYSLFYVFFDQYLTVVADTYKLVGLALASIFVVLAAYFGSLFYPLVVALAATNIVIQVMGMMKPLDIMLNGLSMVNLIIAAGISVEFCGHFVRMFAKASGSGDQRAKIALRKVLTSVLFGITITKVVGLSALTLADSRIFQKYYFRMYMAVVVCGVLNGMLLLPVLLSVFADIKDFFLGRKGEKYQQSQSVIEVGESPMYRPAETVKPTRASDSTGNSNSE